MEEWRFTFLGEPDEGKTRFFKIRNFHDKGWVSSKILGRHLKRPLIREDLKVIQYQSQEADNTFITSDGTSPYNSMRSWAKERHYLKNKNYKPNVEANYVEVIRVLRHA